MCQVSWPCVGDDECERQWEGAGIHQTSCNLGLQAVVRRLGAKTKKYVQSRGIDLSKRMIQEKTCRPKDGFPLPIDSTCKGDQSFVGWTENDVSFLILYHPNHAYFRRGSGLPFAMLPGLVKTPVRT